MPANMLEIMSIANEYDIPVIEDAAEGLGSHINSKSLGTFGTIGVLSFNGNKIITTSGGGALISDYKEYVDEARFLATQARDNAPHYQHSKIGFNYRMSNISAGIGRGQMEVLKERIKQRRANFEFYKNALANIKFIKFLDEPDGYFSNRWLSCILVEPNDKNITRDTIRLALEADNIESRPLWKPMHLQPVFVNCRFYGDGIAESLFEKGLCLPSGSNLSDIDLQRVINIIRDL
jgi:dTDP-4-amino-4,6-dideoxygalactose transaminase